MTKRRLFFEALLASLAVALPIAADAKGGRRGGGSRRSGGSGYSGSGGGGCGSRGGAGYRKANGKCAGRNE